MFSPHPLVFVCGAHCRRVWATWTKLRCGPLISRAASFSWTIICFCPRDGAGNVGSAGRRSVCLFIFVRSKSKDGLGAMVCGAFFLPPTIPKLFAHEVAGLETSVYVTWVFACSSITHLMLVNVAMSVDVMRCIQALQCLRTLVLIKCCGSSESTDRSWVPPSKARICGCVLILRFLLFLMWAV